MNREEFFHSFNLPKNAKIILFISGAAYSLDEADVLGTISSWINERRFPSETKLMVRPYVMLRDREQEQKKYEKLTNDPNLVFNWMKWDESPENKSPFLGMMNYADVIISMFSTTAIEAALLDKPTIAVGFDGYAKRPPHESVRRMEQMHHFKHVLDTGNVKLVRNFDDLFQAIHTYLQDPEIDRQQRKTLVDQLCYRADGLASKRISDVILSYFN